MRPGDTIVFHLDDAEIVMVVDDNYMLHTQKKGTMARSQVRINFTHPRSVQPAQMEEIAKRAMDAVIIETAKNFKLSKETINPEVTIRDL